LFINW